MRNLDLIRQENEQFRNQLAAAVQDGSPDAVAEAFTAYARHIEDSVIAEAQSLAHTTDASILASRGVRQLTGEERNYYCKVIDAMRSDNPRQALSSLDVVLPKTTIDAVFEDLTNTHPLLDAINFQNTSGLVEIIVNTGSKQLATWSALSSEIVKELTGGFKKIGMEHNKLAAFLPVCKAMLDLGPEWLDRYVRTLLSEAIYLGLEESIINGTGKDMPIGMNRQVGDGVTVTGGVYPEKETVELTSLDPITYGILLSGMSTTPNGNSRVIESVLMIVFQFLNRYHQKLSRTGNTLQDAGNAPAVPNLCRYPPFQSTYAHTTPTDAVQRSSGCCPALRPQCTARYVDLLHYNSSSSSASCAGLIPRAFRMLSICCDTRIFS